MSATQVLDCHFACSKDCKHAIETRLGDSHAYTHGPWAINADPVVTNAPDSSFPPCDNCGKPCRQEQYNIAGKHQDT